MAAMIYRVVSEREWQLCKGEAAGAAEKENKIELVLKYLSPAQRVKGERLLQALVNTSDVNWKPNGLLVYKGKVVENANIVDLVSFVTKRLLPSQARSIQLPGLQYFLQAIKDNFLPRELVASHVHAMLSDSTTQSPAIQKEVTKKGTRQVGWNKFTLK